MFHPKQFQYLRNSLFPLRFFFLTSVAYTPMPQTGVKTRPLVICTRFSFITKTTNYTRLTETDIVEYLSCSLFLVFLSKLCTFTWRTLGASAEPFIRQVDPSTLKLGIWIIPSSETQLFGAWVKWVSHASWYSTFDFASRKCFPLSVNETPVGSAIWDLTLAPQRSRGFRHCSR